MDQPLTSSLKAQQKIVDFLKNEVLLLKTKNMLNYKKRILKQNSIIKKKKKLYQKIDAMLKIDLLDAAIKEELLSLQKGIKDLT